MYFYMTTIKMYSIYFMDCIYSMLLRVPLSSPGQAWRLQSLLLEVLFPSTSAFLQDVPGTSSVFLENWRSFLISAQVDYLQLERQKTKDRPPKRYVGSCVVGETKRSLLLFFLRVFSHLSAC